RRFDRPLLSYTVDSKGFENRPDAGTLGVAVLSHFRLVLDYPRRRVILEEGSAGANLPAHEGLSGALLASPGPAFRAIPVAQVIPGSPAAEAGPTGGDEIAEFDGRTLSLAAARALLREPGPVRLAVRRAGATRAVTLTRRPLLP